MRDTRAIVLTSIGTGIAVTTVIVSFTAMLAGGINARIDELDATVNARFDEVDTGLGNIEAGLREMRELSGSTKK